MDPDQIKQFGLAGVGLVIVLWVAWDEVRRRLPRQSPVDRDYADLQALKRLEERCVLLKCPQFDEAVSHLKRHFLPEHTHDAQDHDPNKPA